MKNYSFSSLQPECDIEVVRQMRLANRYRNRLVELELRRRRLRDRLGETSKSPEMRQRLNDRHFAAVRRARAECGLYWGTYLAVEQDAEEFGRGDAPRFRRWDGCGTLAVQIQGGLALDKLLGCEDRRLQLHETGHPKGRLLWMRIGSDGRAPVWAVIPVTWHRDLPADARIKWCRLRRYLVGDRIRWQVLFVIETAAQRRDCDGTRLAAGIDINYRVMGDRQRVATAHGNDGETHELFLPARVIWGMEECERIQSRRATAFDSARERLVKELAAQRQDCDRMIVTDLLLSEAATLSQWRSSRRLSEWVAGWERLGGCPRWLSNWKHVEDRDHDTESQLRDQTLAHRRDVYRCWVAMLAKQYSVAYLERMDLRAAIHGVTGTDADVDAVTPQRRRARWACLSSLRQMIGERLAVVAVKAAGTTVDCHACGSSTAIDSARQVAYTCEHCGAEWDQDENAAKNLLARGMAIADAPIDNETTWSGRKKKKTSRAERNATARKRRSEAKLVKELQ